MTKMSGTGAFGTYGHQVLVIAEVHYNVQQFLISEAMLLDHERYDEWATLLDPDVRYGTRVRVTQGVDEQSTPNLPVEGDYQSLIEQIRCLQRNCRAESAGDGVPPSALVRRLVTNVVVSPCGRGEYDVISYLLVAWSDPFIPGGRLIAVERHDALRRAARSFKIFRREVVIDHSSVRTQAIGILL